MLPLFNTVGEFCFLLDDKIVEDVKMHGIVFGKSMEFRWFTDLEPRRDRTILKIQKSRKKPIQIRKEQKISEFNQAKKDAFEEIH